MIKLLSSIADADSPAVVVADRSAVVAAIDPDCQCYWNSSMPVISLLLLFCCCCNQRLLIELLSFIAADAPTVGAADRSTAVVAVVVADERNYEDRSAD